MAPPSYKPLTSAGGITGAPGLPAEIFAPPADVSFDAVLQMQAQQRAQELANQNADIQRQANELALAEKQRVVEENRQLREAIANSVTPQDPYADGSQVPPVLGAEDQMTDKVGEFDPTNALKTAQRIALQQGDLDTALNVQKGLNTFSNSANRVLTPEEIASLQAQGLEVIDGETLAGARLKMALKNSNVSVARSDAVQKRFEENAPIRDLNETLLKQKTTGTQIRPATEAQVNKIGSSDAFIAQMDDLESRYIPNLSEDRGSRFIQKAANPNSPEARLQGELKLAAKQAALSLEDRVTDADYKMLEDITTIGDLDTNATVIDKMHRLKEFIKRRNASDLNAMEAGGFNSEGLKARKPFMIPKAGSGGGVTGGSVPRNPDGSVLSREQFMQLRNSR